MEGQDTCWHYRLSSTSCSADTGYQQITVNYPSTVVTPLCPASW